MARDAGILDTSPPGPRFHIENTTSGAGYGHRTTLPAAIEWAWELCSKRSPGGIAIWEHPGNDKVAEINHQGELWVCEKYRRNVERTQCRRNFHKQFPEAY